jgi:hypothetical protein
VKNLSIALVSLTCLTLIPSTAFAGPLKNRLNLQQHRIYNGVQNGSLTYDEYQKLEHRQDKLEAWRRQQIRDGGGLTPREFVRINRALNQQSQEIYQQKHD